VAILYITTSSVDTLIQLDAYWLRISGCKQKKVNLSTISTTLQVLYTKWSVKIRIVDILVTQLKITIRLEMKKKTSFHPALVDNVSNNSRQTKGVLTIDSIQINYNCNNHKHHNFTMLLQIKTILILLLRRQKML